MSTIGPQIQSLPTPGVQAHATAFAGPMPPLPAQLPPPQSFLTPNTYYQPRFVPPPALGLNGPIRTAAGPLAQSVPLAPLPNIPPPAVLAPQVFNPNLPPLPSIPPPDALAPCVFNYHVPYGYGNYQYPPGNYYPWAQQPLMPPPPPMQNPASQPVEKPPTPPPPKQEETPPAKPPEKKEDLLPPVKDTASLTPEKVKELNDNLRHPDSNIRMKASNELSSILSADPDILSKPQYREFMEALILKNLRDQSSLVRQPILLAMAVGNLNHPTPQILGALQELKPQGGLYNFESQYIQEALSTLQEKAANASKNGPASQAITDSGTTASTPASPATAPLDAAPASTDPNSLPAAQSLPLDTNAQPAAQPGDKGMPSEADLMAMLQGLGEKGNAPSQPQSAPGATDPQADLMALLQGGQPGPATPQNTMMMAQKPPMGAPPMARPMGPLPMGPQAKPFSMPNQAFFPMAMTPQQQQQQRPAMPAGPGFPMPQGQPGQKLATSA